MCLDPGQLCIIQSFSLKTNMVRGISFVSWSRTSIYIFMNDEVPKVTPLNTSMRGAEIPGRVNLWIMKYQKSHPWIAVWGEETFQDDWISESWSYQFLILAKNEEIFWKTVEIGRKYGNEFLQNPKWGSRVSYFWDHFSIFGSEFLMNWFLIKQARIDWTAAYLK